MATFGIDPSETGDDNDSFGGASPYKAVSKFTLPVAGTVTKLTIRIWKITGDITAYGVIYSDNGNPNALLKVSDAVTVSNAAAAWVDFPMAVSIHLNAGEYWLGFDFDNTLGGVNFREKNDAASTIHYNIDMPPPSDPFGAPTDYAGHKILVYATYTPDAVPATGGSHSCLSPALLSIIECMREKKRVEDKKKLGLILGLWFGSPVFEAES